MSNLYLYIIIYVNAVFLRCVLSITKSCNLRKKIIYVDKTPVISFSKLSFFIYKTP